jgi:tRNA (guanine10-N2)-dimethyltransferase
MRICLYLSQDNLDLAVAEAKTLLRIKKGTSHGAVLCADTASKQYSRLAYSHMALRLFFACAPDELVDKTASYPWKRVLKRFFVRKIGHIKESEPVLAKLIPLKSDIKGPRIVFLEHDGRIFVGELLWENPKEYTSRKAHLRPALHPSSMHPKLAKACVNLLGPSAKTVCDPFCGTGGILIEAALMGLKVVGSDIDTDMIGRCKTNLAHYRIVADIKKADALDLPRRCIYVVTDPPYGKNTSPVRGIYPRFLRKLKENKVKRAIVMFPSTVDAVVLAKDAGLVVERVFTQYLHKSLSKRILVLTNT